MSRIISDKIITQKVLNDDTGELESKEYKEIKTLTGVKGGFSIMYKTYDQAVIDSIRSKTDLEVIIYIRNLFTYKQTNNNISKVKVSNQFNITEQKITRLIKRMVDSSLLMRVERGIYRLNPYMYLPYHADGKALQREWDELREELKYNV